MTAPVTTYSPQTLKRSASALLATAVNKVPNLYRAGASRDTVADHLLVAASLADDLYAEAGA